MLSDANLSSERKYVGSCPEKTSIHDHADESKYISSITGSRRLPIDIQHSVSSSTILQII
jgi:hypothetical protein